MKGCLLIGGGIVLAGIFVGYMAYKIVENNPELLKDTQKKISNVRKKTSKMAGEAKRAFKEGFNGARAGVSTA